MKRILLTLKQATVIASTEYLTSPLPDNYTNMTAGGLYFYIKENTDLTDRPVHIMEGIQELGRALYTYTLRASS